MFPDKFILNCVKVLHMTSMPCKSFFEHSNDPNYSQPSTQREAVTQAQSKG